MRCWLCDESDIEESLTLVDILMQQSNETAAKVHNITSRHVTIKLNQSPISGTNFKQNRAIFKSKNMAVKKF